MRKYDIWKFEITFENCESVDVIASAVEGLCFRRVGSQASMCSSLHGMLVVEEDYIDDLYIKIALDKKAIRQLRPDVWTEDATKRLKESNDITHITINDEYLAVPYEEPDGKRWVNKFQKVEVTDTHIIIRISTKQAA